MCIPYQNISSTVIVIADPIDLTYAKLDWYSPKMTTRDLSTDYSEI